MRDRPLPATDARHLAKGFEHLGFVVRTAEGMAREGNWVELGAFLASLGDWTFLLSREYVRLAETHLDLWRLETNDPPSFSAIMRVIERGVR